MLPLSISWEITLTFRTFVFVFVCFNGGDKKIRFWKNNTGKSLEKREIMCSSTPSLGNCFLFVILVGTNSVFQQQDHLWFGGRETQRDHFHSGEKINVGLASSYSVANTQNSTPPPRLQRVAQQEWKPRKRKGRFYEERLLILSWGFSGCTCDFTLNGCTFREHPWLPIQLFQCRHHFLNLKANEKLFLCLSICSHLPSNENNASLFSSCPLLHLTVVWARL